MNQYEQDKQYLILSGILSRKRSQAGEGLN
jgi:hypothetical protein